MDTPKCTRGNDPLLWGVAEALKFRGYPVAVFSVGVSRLICCGLRARPVAGRYCEAIVSRRRLERMSW